MAGKEEEGGLRGEKGGQTAGGKAKVAGDGEKKKGADGSEGDATK